MSDQGARKLYYDDSYYRALFTSKDSSSVATPHYPSQDMNFSDNYLHGYADHISHAKAFDLSSYNSHISTPKDNFRDDSLVMISSWTEAGKEEKEEAHISKRYKQSKLDREDGGDTTEKINKLKKLEKKEKAPRFAFMTRSATDHLEDGYRWRKYGQKALKKSSYPRGYYRCTTEKCTVKKRVERSFEDPSIVITTYEGSHNHHLPVSLRANVLIGSPSFQNQLNYPIHNYYEETGATARSNGYDIYYHDHLHNNLTPFEHLQFHG